MLPNDPMILLSYLNTRLRDDYASLDALCEDLDLSRAELEKKLEAVGFAYDAEQNRFRRYSTSKHPNRSTRNPACSKRSVGEPFQRT